MIIVLVHYVMADTHHYYILYIQHQKMIVKNMYSYS